MIEAACEGLLQRASKGAYKRRGSETRICCHTVGRFSWNAHDSACEDGFMPWRQVI
jgi:hypothetical protein